MAKVVPISIDINKGKLPQKPKGINEMVEYSTIEEKRRHELEKLTAGFRLFSYFGYDEGVAGHITVRDPEFSDHFWVNPIGVHFGQIKVSDLSLVNHDGQVVQGDRSVNIAAYNSFSTSYGKTRCKCGSSFAFDVWQNYCHPWKISRSHFSRLLCFL